MIIKTEVKDINQEEQVRIIFYDESDESYGFKLTKRTCYDLYSQLREIFKEISE